jgi:hypothetical protein
MIFIKIKKKINYFLVYDYIFLVNKFTKLDNNIPLIDNRFNFLYMFYAKSGYMIICRFLYNLQIVLQSRD